MSKITLIKNNLISLEKYNWYEMLPHYFFEMNFFYEYQRIKTRPENSAIKWGQSLYTVKSHLIF